MMKTNQDKATARPFSVTQDKSGNFYVSKEGRAFCQLAWTCGSPAQNAIDTAKALNEHAALVAVVEDDKRLIEQAQNLFFAVHSALVLNPHRSAELNRIFQLADDLRKQIVHSKNGQTALANLAAVRNGGAK